MMCIFRYFPSILLFWLITPAFAEFIDFSNAALVSSDKSRISYFARVFQEEVSNRTGLELGTVRMPIPDRPNLIFAIREELPTLAPSIRSMFAHTVGQGREGYTVLLSDDRSTLVVLGEDERGLLYGIGKVLRRMQWEPGKLSIPTSVVSASTPAYEIRGHQLGYRPKTNSYDAFSVARFEQYIRELALFGSNSIEIVPPRTDDDFSSRHMPLSSIEMIEHQSRIADRYDMDVWMWYPNMGEDYSHPDSVAIHLKERHEVFAAVPRLDHLFVPGGDPGNLDPDELFAWLESVLQVLRKYHPNAKIWVSPQVFRPVQQWYDRFFYHVNQNYEWLGGVVFGPWVKIPLPELRERVSKEIPIRRYPDITHSLSSQYPVPEWDLPLAMTLGRECINPRPEDQKSIHNALAHLANGSLSYSEGTNDDVNKFIWTDQDWDPNTPVIETLRDYSRFFFGPDWVESVSQGLLLQEENLSGPLINNMHVPVTLQVWKAMEQKADHRLENNFRFQMGLIRAYYDAYVQKKLVLQTAAEHRARGLMQQALNNSDRGLLQHALSELQQSIAEEPAAEWRARCYQLADDLYASIGAQLTIHPHGAAPGRGNFIDNMDAVLSDAPWLMENLQRILDKESEAEWISALDAVVNRANPGPGGFYDNFGHPKSWKRVVFDRNPVEDPGSLYTPRISFGVGLIGVEWVHEVRPVGFGGSVAPQAWMTQVNTLYDTPLKIRYDQLNPDVNYTLRVAYTGRFRSKMKLEVDGGLVVHDFIQTGTQPIHEFDIPKGAYEDGEITFSWTCGEGERGSQVAELWLIVKD